jgi:inner membrane protein YidH
VRRQLLPSVPARGPDTAGRGQFVEQRGLSVRVVSPGSDGELVNTRRPRRVYDVGDEPDPRFTFANERTFLAWIRTALALVAAGISLDAFVTRFPADIRAGVSVAFVLTGAASAAWAYRRWMTNERALRLNRPLPAPSMTVLLAGGVAVLAVLAAGVLIAH